jgi:hypothetical protein
LDTEAGIVPDPTWVNARNYSSLQAAVDAAPTGGSVFIPAGDYTVPSGGLVISRRLAICGEPGTRLFSNLVAANQPVIKLDPQATYVEGMQLRDLELNQLQTPSGFLAGNYGIQCDITQVGGKMGFLLLERVRVANMGDDGIHLDGQGTSDRVFVFVTLRNCSSVLCRGNGLYVHFANMLRVDGSYFSGNYLCGAKVNPAEVHFQGCGFENNCKSNQSNLQSPDYIDTVFDGQAFVKDCPISRFDACHWETFTGANQPRNKRGLTIVNSPCCVVGNSWFFNAQEDASIEQRGIFATYPGGGSLACVIFPNYFSNVKTAIEIDAAGGSAARDCAVFPQFIQVGTGDLKVPWGKQNSGMVTLGKPYATTEPGVSKLRSAMFLPVVTTGELPTPGTPEEKAAQVGLVVFDSQVGLLVMWNGTTWQPI